MKIKAWAVMDEERGELQRDAMGRDGYVYCIFPCEEYSKSKTGRSLIWPDEKLVPVWITDKEPQA